MRVVNYSWVRYISDKDRLSVNHRRLSCNLLMAKKTLQAFELSFIKVSTDTPIFSSFPTYCLLVCVFVNRGSNMIFHQVESKFEAVSLTNSPCTESVSRKRLMRCQFSNICLQIYGNTLVTHSDQTNIQLRTHRSILLFFNKVHHENGLGWTLIQVEHDFILKHLSAFAWD